MRITANEYFNNLFEFEKVEDSYMPTINNGLEILGLDVQNLYFPKHDVFKISNYINDGFFAVCEVNPRGSHMGKWYYKNINKDLFYSEHSSWIYFITVNGIIFKIGESGNPLGVYSTQIFENEIQPKLSSVCRIGRLAAGDGTDSYLRRELFEYIRQGHTITIYAKKCPIYHVEQTVGNKKINVSTTIHKSLEKMYLERCSDLSGILPVFNKAHK